MNLEKEIANSIGFMTEGGTAEIYRGDDGYITARPRQVRVGATGFDLQTPLRRAPRQGKPQTLEQTINDIVPTAAGLVGGATAATLGSLQDIAGLIYGAGKAMTAEEGQRMETFITTAEEISDKYGSGAVRGYVMDKAKEVGLDEAQLETLGEAFTAGEFGGIGGLAKAAVTKGAKMMAKRGVSKAEAPTNKKPGVIAFHGSGADFDEFRLDKIGTGAKATQYGHGLYFSEYEDVATFFRGVASPDVADYELDGISVTDMYNNASEIGDYEKAEVLEQVLLHDRPDQIASKFTVENGYSPKTEEFARSIDYDTLKGVDYDGNEVSLGRTYKTELDIDPDNMLDWQEPLKNQPQAVIDKVRSLVDDDLKQTFDHNMEKGAIGGNAYLNYIGKNKQEASQKLAEAGLDGIKYKDIGGSTGYTLSNAPTNYVVFKPEAIKIVEKYGIVGPVAVTGVAASQQESEPDAGA